jgi:hypothetical protein
MDDNNVYERRDGIQPILVLNGHHSRMKLLFLKYISNEEHLWTVCLGVPYGTHIWQVADSSELNVSFKIALIKAKTEYLTYKAADNQ